VLLCCALCVCFAPHTPLLAAHRSTPPPQKNTPRQTKNQDLAIFCGLLSDLFPGVDPPRKRDPGFEDAIRAAASELRLAPEPDFVDRVVQLSELLAIRHCVFLMGPTGCGRTEVYKVVFIFCLCFLVVCVCLCARGAAAPPTAVCVMMMR
jgi:hypothetical protein